MIPSRNSTLIAVAAGTLLCACAPKDGRNSSAEVAPPSHALITLDSHDDIPLDFATPSVDPATADLQVNLDKMKAGGLNAGFFIVYVGQSARTDENYAKAQSDAETKFAAIHRMADELYPNRIEIAYRADDVVRIAAAGKLVAAIGIENGFVLGKNLEKLDSTTSSALATSRWLTTATTISRARRSRGRISATPPTRPWASRPSAPRPSHA